MGENVKETKRRKAMKRGKEKKMIFKACALCKRNKRRCPHGTWEFYVSKHKACDFCAQKRQRCPHQKGAKGHKDDGGSRKSKKNLLTSQVKLTLCC